MNDNQKPILKKVTVNSLYKLYSDRTIDSKIAVYNLVDKLSYADEQKLLNKLQKLDITTNEDFVSFTKQHIENRLKERLFNDTAHFYVDYLKHGNVGAIPGEHIRWYMDNIYKINQFFKPTKEHNFDVYQNLRAFDNNINEFLHIQINACKDNKEQLFKFVHFVNRYRKCPFGSNNQSLLDRTLQCLARKVNKENGDVLTSMKVYNQLLDTPQEGKLFELFSDCQKLVDEYKSFKNGVITIEQLSTTILSKKQMYRPLMEAIPFKIKEDLNRYLKENNIKAFIGPEDEKLSTAFNNKVKISMKRLDARVRESKAEKTDIERNPEKNAVKHIESTIV